jgi:CheY-like chemotaxis protein
MNHSSTCESAIAEGALCLEIEEFDGGGGEEWNNAPLAGESRTILLVEDETFVREVASEVLRAAGYRVLTAKSAAEAVRIFENGFDIDLLLTDVVLPGETGRVLAERLRRANPQLPVLLATGYGEQMARETSEECLAKPFSSEDLLGRVRQLLEKAPWRKGPIHAGLRRRVACRI